MGWLMWFSPNLTAFLVGWVRLFVFEIFEHFFWPVTISDKWRMCTFIRRVSESYTQRQYHFSVGQICERRWCTCCNCLHLVDGYLRLKIVITPTKKKKNGLIIGDCFGLIGWFAGRLFRYLNRFIISDNQNAIRWLSCITLCFVTVK